MLKWHKVAKWLEVVPDWKGDIERRMEGEFPKMVWPPKVRLEATDDNNARQSPELAFKWDDNYLTCQMHH